MTAGFAGGEPLLDPDAAMDYVRGWQGRIDRMAADTRAMNERLGQLRVSARDSNGLVEVTIDSTGVLVDVTFTDRIQRFAPDVVSRAVMSALGEARRTATERSTRIVTETMGGDSVAARTIAARLEQRLRGEGDSSADPR